MWCGVEGYSVELSGVVRCVWCDAVCCKGVCCGLACCDIWNT